MKVEEDGMPKLMSSTPAYGQTMAPSTDMPPSSTKMALSKRGASANFSRLQRRFNEWGVAWSNMSPGQENSPRGVPGPLTTNWVTWLGGGVKKIGGGGPASPI